MAADFLDPVAELGGDREGLLRRPAVLDSLLNSRPMNASFALPFHYGLALAERFDDVVVGAVVLLHKHCRPTTVARLVVAVAVDPINRMLRRRLPAHIGKERLEAAVPALTYLDPAPTVPRELRIQRIIASVFDAKPCPMLWRSGLPVGCVALDANSAAHITIVATARSNLAAAKRLSIYGHFIAAVAQTAPKRVLVLVRWAAHQGRKATELLTRQINESRHSPHMVIATCNCKR